jgi:malate permease and related proteins
LRASPARQFCARLGAVTLVAATVIAATAAGIVLEHTTAFAPRLARRCLSLMLYVLVPFVAYTSFAHLHVSIDAGVGLALAYAGLGIGGVLAYAIGKRWLALPRPSLGALVCSVLLVNTAYLGLPMTVAVLGTSHLSQAVAYDQVVSGPMLFTVGFAVGAAFGTAGARQGGRLLAVVTRNPPLIAAIAGLLVPTSLAPHALVVASHYVVDALLVIGFVAVGISLSTERREDQAPLLERPDRRVGVALVLRFATTTSLLGLASLVGVAIPSAYLLQAAMPSGINSLIVGHAFGLDQHLIATMIVWSTLAVLVVGLAASAL